MSVTVSSKHVCKLESEGTRQQAGDTEDWFSNHWLAK